MLNIYALVIAVMLLAQPVGAQEPAKPPAPVRNVVLALQQMGAAIETLSIYYEGRIEELKRVCGDPCKDK